jgi:hypothetical protein
MTRPQIRSRIPLGTPEERDARGMMTFDRAVDEGS